MTNHDVLLLIASLLGLAVIALVMVAWRLRPVSQQRLADSLRQAFDDVTRATQAHVQANAVLALVDQFVSRPEVAANLANYSQQMVAAAITYRINATTADIKTASLQLSINRKELANGYTSFRSNVQDNEALLQHLQQELTALYELGENFGLPRMVAVD